MTLATTELALASVLSAAAIGPISLASLARRGSGHVQPLADIAIDDGCKVAQVLDLDHGQGAETLTPTPHGAGIASTCCRSSS